MLCYVMYALRMSQMDDRHAHAVVFVPLVPPAQIEDVSNGGGATVGGGRFPHDQPASCLSR